MKNYKKRQTKLESKLEVAIKSVTPGVCARVYKDGKLIYDIRVGKTHRYYDLASLTKIIFTASVVMRAEEQKLLKVNDLVYKHIPWFPHKKVKIKDLLTHSSGLVAWEPIYKYLRKFKSLDERWEHLRRHLREMPISKKKKSVYSDFGFLLLSQVLERVYQKPLIYIWQDYYNQLAQKSTFHFNVNNKIIYKKSQYAPTEKCPWRKKTLRGEVHDDNTWTLGGVSTHAGLFGTIEDVSIWGLKLRNAYYGKNTFIKTRTCRKFLKRAVPKSIGDWALGFMVPTNGKSSGGKYLSEMSYGHTGFTGTSFWFDAKKDLMIIILSNRVHPTRRNQRYAKLRPEIHNWIIESLS